MTQWVQTQRADVQSRNREKGMQWYQRILSAWEAVISQQWTSVAARKGGIWFVLQIRTGNTPASLREGWRGAHPRRWKWCSTLRPKFHKIYKNIQYNYTYSSHTIYPMIRLKKTNCVGGRFPQVCDRGFGKRRFFGLHYEAAFLGMASWRREATAGGTENY